MRRVIMKATRIFSAQIKDEKNEILITFQITSNFSTIWDNIVKFIIKCTNSKKVIIKTCAKYDEKWIETIDDLSAQTILLIHEQNK
jgi:hypothetical protein